MNPKLASEATTKIHFGESTTVKIDGQSVKLKGTFYRDDDIEMKQLLTKDAQVVECHGLINNFSAEKYPYDAAKPLPERVARLVKDYQFEKSEKNKLLEMVATRDTTIRELKAKAKTFDNRLLSEVKDFFFRVISIIASEKNG